MKMTKICLLKKTQIKIYPDNATYNILKYKVALIEMWYSFRYYYSFRYLKASFVLPYLGIILSAFSLSNCKPFFKISKGCGCPKTKYQ